jgi:hypothetical protein
MMNSFNSLCDDFYVDMYINTELDLPSERDIVLSFFERIRKQFPSIENFYRRNNGDFCLEEEREGERYRWVLLEIDRICSGCSNPGDMEEAYSVQRLVLELAPYMLGVSQLDIDSLDVTFTMDFDYQGNHNEVIADALFSTCAFNTILELPKARPVSFSPMAVIALDEDCSTQARISVESRTGAYEIKNGKFKQDEPISLYFTIRRQAKFYENFDVLTSFSHQCRIAEELMAEKIIPEFVGPLTNAIAQRR